MSWSGLKNAVKPGAICRPRPRDAVARSGVAIPNSVLNNSHRSRPVQSSVYFSASAPTWSTGSIAENQHAPEGPDSPSLRVTDKRNHSSSEQPPAAHEPSSSAASDAPSSDQPQTPSDQPPLSQPSESRSTSTPQQADQQHQQPQQTGQTGPAGPTSYDDLLKQRFYHAQEQNKRASSGLSSLAGAAAGINTSFTLSKSDQTVIPPDPSAISSSSSSSSASPSTDQSSRSQPNANASTDTVASPEDSSEASNGMTYDPRFNRNASSPSFQSLQIPFDTLSFVQKLEQGGWKSLSAKSQTTTSTSKALKNKQNRSTQSDNGMQLQIARRHDPAEAIMEGVRYLLTTRGHQLIHACLNKGDVENQAYLFKAALSELRTEVEVRARNDAASLRSITILLQREVDALEQKMKEDVERIKHDIQVDMNNRKSESKEEQNSVEQEIQDLHNRFTINLSDLKTEIEQNVKWDATRRSLALVFGAAAIVAASLAIADYATRDDDAARAAAANREPITAGHPPASTDAAAPASLSWATEGRILSVLPLFLAKPNSRSSANIRRSLNHVQRSLSRQCPVIATIGLHVCLHARDHHRTSKLPLSPSSMKRRHQSTLANKTTQQSGYHGENILRVPDSDVIIRVGPTSVSLESVSLGLKTFELDHVWLRDACQAPESVHPSNRQKLFHTSDVPLNVSLLDPAHPPKLVSEASEPILRITFSKLYPVVNAFTAAFGNVNTQDTAHVSDFPVSFLLRHAMAEYYANAHMDVMAVAEGWLAKDLTHFDSEAWKAGSSVRPDAVEVGSDVRPARIPWEAIHSETEEADQTKSRFALVQAIVRDGFAFVTRLPTDNTATEEGSKSARLRDLAGILGELRNTFYGPLWDVQSKADARNIAYTNIDLGLHMDLLYFQNPPRFQFLHMLRNKVRGGASIFVDSFKVAERMWQENRELWEVLTKVPVGFHYVNDGRHYRFTHPTLELAHDTEGHAGPPLAGTTMPRLSAVNYSPPFQSPLPLHPTKHLESAADRQKFYAALKRFSDLTLSEEFRYEKQMKEGECVIFDNRRVLHSRKGFEWDQSQTGEVKRWLKGCYVDGDAIWSTYRVLKTKMHGSKPILSRGTRDFGTHATTQKRTFVTSARSKTVIPALPVDAASFAPSSDDPTVVDSRSRMAIRTNASVLSMTSYRPVPPLTLSTLTKLYRQLSKSRLTFLVVLTGMAGYALCPAALTVAGSVSPVVTLLALTVGMTLCSAAANTLNQLVEAPYDAQMLRTRARPLPSRSVTPLHAFSVASVSSVGGVGLLAWMVNPITAGLGAANIALYSFTYTPMKRLSIANTWVGAVVGALPPLMGWTACTGSLHYASDLGGWSLAALLFAWQFPHFNSLAHTLRAEYARGGYRMMAVTDPALNRRVSLRYAIALLPICTLLLPYSGIVSPIAYAALTTPFNLLMAHAAWQFYRFGTVKTARWCFWVSLIYLPAVMLLAMGCKPELWTSLRQSLGKSEEVQEEEEEKLV